METVQILPPVKVNELLTGVITAIGNKGHGIIRIQQPGSSRKYIVFVENAVLGKKYDVQVTKVLEKFSFASIIKENTKR